MYTDIKRKIKEFVWCCSKEQQEGFVKTEFMKIFKRNESIAQHFLSSMVELGYLHVEKHWHEKIRSRPYVYFPTIQIIYKGGLVKNKDKHSFIS